MTAEDRLYHLLPAIHRIRDAEQGYPLRTVLRVIASQAALLEAGIARLYDDWFIETCEDWVVPYIADLVGVSMGPLGARTDPAETAARRRQVANALSDRRAKGTLAVLERLAADVTGWPARAIEFGPLVAVTQSARHPDPGRGRLTDVRDTERLEDLGTAFDTAAMTDDTRAAAASRLTPVRGLPAVAVAVWRLASDDTDRAPALCVNDDNHYAFDPLGRDLPLCVRAERRAPGTPPAGRLDVPALITTLALGRRLEDYYGPNRSLCLYRRSGPVPRGEIVAADLGGWRYRPRHGQVAVDPALGRIAFPPGDGPEDGLWVRYSRLVPGDLGGGHYARSASPPAQPAADPPAVYRVSAARGGALPGIAEALRVWASDRAAGHAGPRAIIEITDDETYEENLRIELPRGQHLEIRAASGCRPVIRPAGQTGNRSQRLVIAGVSARRESARARRGRPGERRARTGTVMAVTPGPPGQPGPLPAVVLSGLWVTGHGVELASGLGPVTVRHCSLVPSGELDGRETPGLLVRGAPDGLTIDHSVIAGTGVDISDTATDPFPMLVTDSIMDVTGLSRGAIAGPDGDPAYVVLGLNRVTVLGSASVHQVSDVEDTIVTGRLHVSRRQTGAVRFSYVPEGSGTPRRTRCQPDGVREAAGDARQRTLAVARVAPRFDDLRMTAPGYARLSEGTAPEILTGASDEGELGAFHDLWLGLRASNLRARIQEFTPVGADIGVLFAS